MKKLILYSIIIILFLPIILLILMLYFYWKCFELFLCSLFSLFYFIKHGKLKWITPRKKRKNET